MSVAAQRALVRKMHGTHNVFFVLDERPPRLGAYAELARRLCAGEGTALEADGLLVIEAPPAGDAASLATMRVVNADGSEPEMCGNGVRCVARYLAENGAGDRFTLATKAGPIGIEIVGRAQEFLVRVDMGEPHFLDDGARSIEAAGGIWNVHRVSLGNPHAVIFVDDVAAPDLERLGRELGTHELFPQGVNAHVARRVDGSTLDVRHYERGVGLTQACGTGAGAAAAAAVREGLVTAPVEVRVPGGRLAIEWTPGRNAFMTGPAESIDEREIAL